VLVTPVYAAGEQPIPGVDADALVEGLKRRGHRHAATVADADALADELAATLRPDDMIVCLGAGDITKWAAGLADAIEARNGVAG
jgi:UDP-N-acetylmuramate--alanine ligase